MVMRVTVAATADGLVQIGSPGVRGTGEWRGAAAPVVGAEVDVELEPAGQVDWADVVLDPALHDIVHPGDGELVLDGLVDDVDQYGVLTLQLVGGFVLIDTTGDPPFGIVGRRVRLFVRGTVLYPSTV
jgi:hypothetical protein